jgi:small-conductance mechanosensitive channel
MEDPGLHPDLPQDMALAQAADLDQLLTALNRLTAQLQQQSQQQQQFNDTLVQILQTITSSAVATRGSLMSAAKRNTATTKSSFSEFESKDLRKSHAKGSAEEKLRRAFGAIVAHNEAPGRNSSEKWAVNQNALAELTGCNRPAIKQFLSQYGAEIEAHHHQHQLLPRHNYSHGKNGIKITDVIQW